MPRRISVARAALLSVVIGAAAACSSSSATPTPLATAPTTTPSPRATTSSPVGTTSIPAASSSVSAPTIAPSPGGPAVVNITITNASCVPDPSSVPAGSVTFDVTNDGGDRVSEIELKLDERIIGEKENLVPGLSADFTVTLEPGTYEVECPGAETSSSAFTVTAAAASSASG